MLSDTIFYTPASGQIKQAVIMFHGYGSNGNDLISLAPQMADKLPDTIFYSPNAPDVLTADGYKWYDVDELASAGVYERFDYIEKLMKKAKEAVWGAADFMRYIEYKHSLNQGSVVLMGFSQGALMALMMGLSYAPAVKGIIACSSIPLTINEGLTINEVKSTPPVLLTHGTADDVVPYMGMQITENTLKNLDCKVTTHVVKGMGHAIDFSCKNAMIDFMSNL